jgi:hypothetical protein
MIIEHCYALRVARPRTIALLRLYIVLEFIGNALTHLHSYWQLPAASGVGAILPLRPFGSQNQRNQYLPCVLLRCVRTHLRVLFLKKGLDSSAEAGLHSSFLFFFLFSGSVLVCGLSSGQLNLSC